MTPETCCALIRAACGLAAMQLKRRDTGMTVSKQAAAWSKVDAARALAIAPTVHPAGAS